MTGQAERGTQPQTERGTEVVTGHTPDRGTDRGARAQPQPQPERGSVDLAKLRAAVADARYAEQGLRRIGRCASRLSEAELTELVLGLRWEVHDAHCLPEIMGVYLAPVPETVRDRLELAVFRFLFSMPSIFE